MRGVPYGVSPRRFEVFDEVLLGFGGKAIVADRQLARMLHGSGDVALVCTHPCSAEVLHHPQNFRHGFFQEGDESLGRFECSLLFLEEVNGLVEILKNARVLHMHLLGMIFSVLSLLLGTVDAVECCSQLFGRDFSFEGVV